ncbi:MAG: cytochrome c [Phycisphaerales bacterium]|nr:cytochrome c [Phycisphaerales bacterium]
MISLLLVLLLQGPGEQSVPTWHGDIHTIIRAHCTECHAENGPGPFKLETYEEVRARAGFIKAVVQEGIMPPWLPGPAGLSIQGHRGLSQAEIELIKAWVSNGSPLGKPGAVLDEIVETTSRTADLQLKMLAPWPVPAEGGGTWGRVVRDKRTFVVPVNNNQSLRIQGYAYETNSPTVVHAVTFLADTTGSGRYLDARENGPGYYMAGDVRDTPSGDIGGVGVGARELVLPDGFHWEIPKESDLLMQVQYRPSGKIEFLHDRLHAWTTRLNESRPLRTLLSMIWRVDVPAGETAHLQDSWTLPVAVDLVGFTPRANGIVSSMNLNATLPDGDTQVLLDVPRYDPHWGQTWLLDNPRHLPAGTRLTGSWVVSNTESNPRNPFMPLDRYVAARRTGVLGILMHVAAVNPDEDASLLLWRQEMLQSRQRPQ